MVLEKTEKTAIEDATIEELIELMFFAYRDFVSDPDTILAKLGFGRAHHRVMHFVDRKPGLTVAELLELLGITKQSLARVLKQLVQGAYIEQREGPQDRRQRELYLTTTGQELITQLRETQSRRIREALKASSQSPQEASQFLKALIGDGGKRQIETLD